MAKFEFEADATQEGGNYKPVPDGAYVLGVAKAELAKTSTDKHMLKLELAIDEGPYIGRKVWTNIVFNPKGEAGHGLTVQALKAFGFEYDGKFTIDTDEWDKTRTCRANLVTESYQKDGVTKYKNVIPTAGFITDDESSAAPASKPTPQQSKPAVAKKPAGNVAF